uniref:Uncharacterized protein n=1 Tax=Anguilla anguilla TaxID=7936 RepID=A0A0E9P8D3_ANGAN
MFPNPLPE